MIDKHPLSAPLRWMCSSLVVAGDPSSAWDLLERFDDDASDATLAASLEPSSVVAVPPWSRAAEVVATRPDVTIVGQSFAAGAGRSGAAPEASPDVSPVVVIVDVVAACGELVLVEPSAHDLVAESGDAPVWAVCPVGTRLHRPMVEDINAVAEGRLSVCQPDIFAAVVTGSGVVSNVAGARRGPDPFAADGPYAPELLILPAR